jgi:hypothetical protein
MLFKKLVGRDPIDARGFHRYLGDAMQFKPRGQIMQVVSKSAKRPNWGIRHVGIYRRSMFPCADINSSRTKCSRSQSLQACGSLALPSFILLLATEGRGSYKSLIAP